MRRDVATFDDSAKNFFLHIGNFLEKYSQPAECFRFFRKKLTPLLGSLCSKYPNETYR